MFFKYKKLFLIFITLLSACSINNLHHKTNLNNLSILIETPSDRDNILLKENLRRLINNNNQNSQTKYKLKASISFNNTETLSVRGLQVLNSTKAIIKYTIIENNNGNLIKSGSFVSFPALNSASNSLYSNEVAKVQIKERLSLLSAKKLYTILQVTIGRLN